MNSPEIHFRTCISAYNCLREMCRIIGQTFGAQDGWRIMFGDGIRGFAARLTTVMESHRLLDEPFSVPLETFSPEQWAVESDRRIGEIFFGMDSALECLVFALNSIGYLKSPSDFCDIKTVEGLKQVKPDNIVSRMPQDKKNPRSGYAKFFPRVVACWNANRSLIDRIMEYHDVSKHRSCIISSSTPGQHSLPDRPKEPGSLFRVPVQTVEETVTEFHRFAEKLLIEVVEELSSVFGVSIGRVDHP